MFKAIKYFFIFLYHFFFIDQATGHQSNTKFFANVGYLIWCVLFPIVVLKGITTSMELWMVFGAVIIGNRTLNVMLQNKAGVPAAGMGSWKDMMSPVDGDPNDQPSTQTTVTVTTAAQPVPPAQPAPAQVVTTTTSGPNIPNTSDLVD